MMKFDYIFNLMFNISYLLYAVITFYITSKLL